jgi:pimeloyl-ACP methyl ester carboxylesterase
VFCLNRLIVTTIFALLCPAACMVSPSKADDIADQESKQPVREVRIDPISRNFMAPMLEDFFRPDEAGLKYEEVSFLNETNESLRGWFIPVDGADKTVLFCMGNTGNISGMLLYAKLLTDGGVNVMLFDYQGFGGSTGIATALSLLGDTLSAFDYLTNTRGISAKDIGVFGVSLGSPLAIAVAAERHAGAVAVEDVLLPSAQIEMMKDLLRDDFATRMALGALRTIVLPKVEPLTNVPRLKCPLFLLHGEHDRLLPPSGSVEVAKISKVPTRVWIMQGAGHAPETLEVNELEYASQIQRFFHEALNGNLSEPDVSMTSRKKGEQWTATVIVEADMAAAWQIVVGSVDGKFRFARRHAQGKFQIDVQAPFEPVCVSAIAFENFKAQPDGTWVPELSDLSQSLADFRRLQQGIAVNCRWRLGVQSSRGLTFQNQCRVPQDWDWLQQQLLASESIHPGVRPRYAREIAQFYCRLSTVDQEACLPIVDSMLQYMPDDPDKYYQLDNAGFQLKLEDPAIAHCLTCLARKQFGDGKLAEASATLRRAVQVAHPKSPLKSARFDSLTAESDFDVIVGLKK